MTVLNCLLPPLINIDYYRLSFYLGSIHRSLLTRRSPSFLEELISRVWLGCFTFLFVFAGVEHISSLVENAISGNSMGSLIYQPSGCGEQNMIHMTLPVIATTYLDKTKQWESVGFQKRAEALEHIKTGKLTFNGPSLVD